MKGMTRWGVGPRFAIASGAIGFAMITINHCYFPSLSLPNNPICFWLGTITVLVGIGLLLFAIVQVHRAFSYGRLVTNGVYAYIRHPVYAVWILFIVPGLFLTTGALFLIVLPFLMYGFVTVLTVEEDEYLKQRFGEEFTDYKKRVNAIIPKLSARTGKLKTL
jgi:protein-S-isoprenylcysteine O-methyltransferase Ste14